jgi:hypothetical protein
MPTTARRDPYIRVEVKRVAFAYLQRNQIAKTSDYVEHGSGVESPNFHADKNIKGRS